MKKIICLLLAIMSQFKASAQTIFGSGGATFMREIEANWAWIVPSMWLVGAMISYGVHMTGSDKDSKKFWGGVILSTATVGGLVAAYAYVKTMSI